VLLFGAPARVGVPIARCFARRRIPAVVGVLSDVEVSVPSRAIRSYVPFDVSQPLLPAVMRCVEREKIDTIIPCTDLGLSVLAEHYDALRGEVRVCAPPPRAVANALDKEATVRAATRCGIRTPRTFPRLAGAAELDANRTSLTFPLIAKGRSRQAAGVKINYYYDYESLRAEFESDASFGVRNILQEYCEGFGVGIAALISGGRPLTLLQYARLKELDPSGGNSVLAQTESLKQNLANEACALLRELEWDGVAMVEFRRRPSDGQTVLMEVNGRYWGSIALVLQAGIELPYYEWQLAHGVEPSIPAQYAVGVRMRWFVGDLGRLASVLLKKPKGAPYYPSRPRELIRFFADFNPRTRSALWSWSDPVPAFAELTWYAKTLGRALVRKGVRAVAGRKVTERLHELRRIDTLARRRYIEAALARSIGKRPRGFVKSDLQVKNVLVLCKGNVMRSPLAAELLKQRLTSLIARVAVGSAGLSAKPGEPAHPLARAAAEAYGVSLAEHRARRVTAEMVGRADVIFVMDYVNQAELIARFPQAADKTYLYAATASASRGESPEIFDPQGHDEATIHRCFQEISDRAEILAGALGRSSSA
jgi:protein-tyrosine-phosphatase/predicted ATP-grasp superfamily ATP-dependent carboligase